LKDLSRAGEGSKKRFCHRHEDEELVRLRFLAHDALGVVGDMPVELDEQKELITGLVKLAKESNASLKKAIGEIMELAEDKAKLHNECDLLKEEIAGWKKMHEKNNALLNKTKAVTMEYREDMVKLHIERDMLKVKTVVMHGEMLLLRTKQCSMK
jgi:seryl-tRNA synthetase